MSSNGSSSNRQDLVQNAILFLNDPKVQSSTLAAKISFLESKGLNESEIQEALSRAPKESTTGESSFARRSPYDTAAYEPPRYGYEYGVVPPPPRRDWRDTFIMAVISGGVAYGLTALARKYLLPHLQPPSTTSFQQTSQDLSSSYDEAARLLNDLSDQTSQLQTSLEQDRERINKVVEDVEHAVMGVKAGEERWREEMRDMRGEVDSLKDLVPRMMEKHASNQSSALTDLQSELRSLKTLLQSRQLGTNGTSSPGGANAVSSTQVAANALLAPKGRGIPAWQLASASDEKQAEGYSIDSASGSSSMTGSEVLGSAVSVSKEDGDALAGA